MVLFLMCMESNILERGKRRVKGTRSSFISSLLRASKISLEYLSINENLRVQVKSIEPHMSINYQDLTESTTIKI